MSETNPKLADITNLKKNMFNNHLLFHSAVEPETLLQDLQRLQVAQQIHFQINPFYLNSNKAQFKRQIKDIYKATP